VAKLSVTAKNRRALWITFGLIFTYFLVEFVGGLWTNSFALLANATHITPQDDQDFTKRLFTPIPLEGVAYLSRTKWPISKGVPAVAGEYQLDIERGDREQPDTEEGTGVRRFSRGDGGD
jgi:hypothetical protein